MSRIALLTAPAIFVVYLLLTRRVRAAVSPALSSDAVSTRLGQEPLGLLGAPSLRDIVEDADRELDPAGLIEYGRGAVKITNRAQLEVFACECYSVIRDYSTGF